MQLGLSSLGKPSISPRHIWAPPKSKDPEKNTGRIFWEGCGMSGVGFLLPDAPREAQAKAAPGRARLPAAGPGSREGPSQSAQGGRKIEGDSWFTWWFNHLPGPSICPKRTPMFVAAVVRRNRGGDHVQEAAGLRATIHEVRIRRATARMLRLLYPRETQCGVPSLRRRRLVGGDW